MRGTGISLALTVWGLAAVGAAGAAAGTVNTNAAYSLLANRTEAVRTNFFVYLDADSGFNHGFPSGFFADHPATLAKIHLNSACIDDASSPTGCSSNPNALDQVRGTVLHISFDPLTAKQYAGVNIEEPEGWGADPRDVGYDLNGSSQVVFDARSPSRDGAMVQFGVGGRVTPFFSLTRQWESVFFSLSSLRQAEGSTAQCPPDLSTVHILFTVVVDGTHAPADATVLLDKIRFAPVPAAQHLAARFPLSTATFGVNPMQQAAPGRLITQQTAPRHQLPPSSLRLFA